MSSLLHLLSKANNCKCLSCFYLICKLLSIFFFHFCTCPYFEMYFFKISIWGVILICRLETGYYLNNSDSFDYFCFSFPFFWWSHMYWNDFRGTFTTRFSQHLPQLHFHLPGHPRSASDDICHCAFFVIPVKGQTVYFQNILVGFILGFLNHQGRIFVKYKWKTDTWSG